jgi:hypothetical protein
MFCQCLLRSATGAGVVFDRSSIHHDGESKSGVGFGLFHYLKGSEITGRSLPIPVNDDAINAAADHVLNLPRDLLGTGGVVSDIHMTGSTKPAHEVRINLCMISGIQQRVNIQFAEVAGGDVAVHLSFKSINRAGVVGRLLGQSGGRRYHQIVGVGDRLQNQACQTHYEKNLTH